MTARSNARRVVDANVKQSGVVEGDDNIKTDLKYYRNMCSGIN
jgi:hypothetical protein